MRIENKRNIAADNLRALMIICVVVGHLIEVLPDNIDTVEAYAHKGNQNSQQDNEINYNC